MKIKTMIAPQIHLNGDRKEELQRQLIAAADGVRHAMAALSEATPNARNYYVIGPNAYTQALEEHIARVTRLANVRQELIAMWEAIDDNQIAFDAGNGVAP